MTDSQTRRNPVEELAEDFLERYRRGEHPPLSEYIQQHPDLADEIRELFPALVMMEEAGPRNAGAGRVTADGQPLQHVGDYHILREVGRGGMGVVYEAEQESLGRHVALKVLPFEAAADPHRLQRFRREARSAARLHHTNIVPVHDVGSHQGIHYYAMQFICGQGLDEVLHELHRLRLGQEPAPTGERPPESLAGSLAGGLITGEFLAEADPVVAPSPDRATTGPDPATCASNPLKPPSDFSAQSGFHYYRSVARLGLQVAEALAYAHGQKVLHRDIKPSNLLLDLQGTVWVTDFGLAKGEGDDLTRTGDLVGTLRYMAPERFNGVSDPRSDVYSLGLTLYELLTLQPAFEESDRARLIKRVTHEEPPPPRACDGQIPRDLETVVLKAIAKEPERRYQTAEKLAEDLRRFLADRPVLARRTPWYERLRRWGRRNPAVASLSFGLALMALVVTVVSVLAALRLGRAAEQEQWAKREAQEQLCDSLLVQAHAGRTSQRPGQRLDSLKALERAAQLGRTLGRGPTDFAKWRAEAVACLALPDVRLGQEWEGHPAGTNGLGFDAHFERYAWSFKDEGIRICRAADQQVLRRLPTRAAERVTRWLIPRFSPDGRFLAVWYYVWATERPLEVWDLQSRVSRPLITLPDAATQPEFSPDGNALIAGLADKSLWQFNLVTGQEGKRIALDLVPERLAFHPDGQKLAVSSITPSGSAQDPWQVQVRDLAGGQILYRLSHPAGAQAVAWHPGGRLLATGCDDRRIYLWDGLNGTRRGVLEGHSWEVHDLAFSQSGDWLASFGWDMTLRLWDVAAAKQLWHLEDVRVVGFRREEPLEAAAISGRQVRRWACVPSNEFRVLHGPAPGVRGIDPSPDGRYLTGVTGSDETWLWDIRHKPAVAHFADVCCCGWDAQGNLLFTTNDGQLVRRPLRNPGDTPEDQWELGPGESLLAQPLQASGLRYGVWCGRDGRLLLISSRPPSAQVQMFRIDGKANKMWARPVPNHMTTSSTADGRWLALGTQDGGRGVSILEARSGELVEELAIGDAQPAFSPDGRWLVTTTGRLTTPEGECCLWRTDTWKKVRSVPLRRASSSAAPLAVSPDGALVAVAYTMSEITLLRLETLEKVVTLTAPELGLITSIGFSPDGRHLFVPVANTVHVWDLPALRRGLRDTGLDWDLATDSAPTAHD